MKAPPHQRDGRRFAVGHRDFRGHRLRGRQLRFTAERHQYGAGADCGIKPFDKAFLRADVEVAHHGKPFFTQRRFRTRARIGERRLDFDIGTLGRAV